MLLVEMKKIFLHQKGLLILLLSLSAYVVLSLCNGYDSSYVLEQNQNAYHSYMEHWKGAITKEKAQEMEDEYSIVNRTDNGKKAVFMTLYNQYYYAKEDITHRYLMDERGWNTLLTHDGLNFMLVLCLLALFVPVFCGEYQCGMNQILRSCRNGRNRLACIKLFTMIIVAVCTAVLFQMIQLLVVSRLVGLDGYSYPLQSISFFEHSPYVVTIGQAYAIVFFCRLIGAAWFAVLIALLSNLFRHVVLTAFAGITVSVLPHLIGNNFIKYILPLPAGPLAGAGYIWGKITEPTYDEKWNLINSVIFRGVTPMELGILMTVFLAVLGILFYASLRCYVGRRKRRMPHSAVAILLLFVVTMLTGCTPQKTSEKDFHHNLLSDAAQGENTNYSVTLNRVKNKIYAKEKKSGKTILLNRSPFPTDKSISSIFVDKSACYYAAQGYAGMGFEIYRIDLKSFSEQLYFSSILNNTATFWGLHQHDLTEEEILADSGAIASFAVDESYIYYVQDGRYRRICRLTGQEES